MTFRNAAAAAARALQQWYGADSFAQSTGLYHYDDPTIDWFSSFFLNLGGDLDSVQDMKRWWDDANATTAVIDYMLITGDRTWVADVENTFANAPNGYTVDVGWTVASGITGGVLGAAAGAAIGAAIGGPVGLIVGGIAGLFGGAAGGAALSAATYGRIYYTNFLNSFYDDEGWWALALIRGYDLTRNVQYLADAVTIFNDMTGGWDSTCRGGIYWAKDHKGPDGSSPYKNAIANELFMAIAAALYARLKPLEGTPLGGSVDAFLNWALQEWRWFSGSGLINRQNLVNDSLNPSCVNDGSQPVWTYNQGVILGALCDLAEITGDSAYLASAEQIADALIRNPASGSGTPESGVYKDGILTEWSDLGADDSIDHCQFKGVFVRNLAKLWTKTHNATYRAFLMKNAATAVKFMNSSSQFGRRWDSPPDVVDFIRQSSALDLLNAAMMVQFAPDLAFLTPLLFGERPDLAYLDPLLLER